MSYLKSKPSCQNCSHWDMSMKIDYESGSMAKCLELSGRKDPAVAATMLYSTQFKGGSPIQTFLTRQSFYCNKHSK